MEFFIDNWVLIVAGGAIVALTVLFVIRFCKQPGSEQIAKVREWLLWAVTEAEKDLGGGTGRLKLRQVYDLFVVRFPWIAKVISFDRFSSLVDEALEDMRELLKSNADVKNYVEGVDSYD